MKITLLATNPHTAVEVTEGNVYSLKFDHILLEDGKYLFNGEVFSPLGSSTEILPFAVMNWCTSLKLVSRAKYQAPDVSVLHSFVKPLEQVVESFADFNSKITMAMKPLSEEDANTFKELFEYNQKDIVYKETHHPSNKAKQLLKLAEELHDTYQKAWLEVKGVGRVYHWENASEAKKHAWVELARKYSQPTSDLQQQLDDALKSERELMGCLRDIGGVFNMNVGTDIGTVELAGFIEKKVNSHIQDGEKYRKLRKFLINNLDMKSSVDVNNICDSLAKRHENYKETKEELRNLRRGLLTVLKMDKGCAGGDEELIKRVSVLYEKSLPKPPQPLIQVIKDHKELHDLITHLHDFKTAVEFYHEATQFHVRDFDESDQSYWEKQVRTVNRLIELTK